jgi:RND family efflux transporter MFP subunit
MSRGRIWIVGVVVSAGLLAVGALVAQRLLAAPTEAQQARAPLAAPVEVAPVERGPIEIRRVFSGSLAPTERTTIAPKVAGRIISLPVDLADTVERGQVVARLDDAEFEQVAAQAEAELAVAKAGLVEATNGADIAKRELDRVTALHERGIASDSQLDTARAQHLSAESAVAVARAQVTRAEAALETARIRLGYSTIRAEWEGGSDTRIVSERYVEEGETVSANTALLSIIKLDPIEAVIFATERDYALLSPDQPVTLTTDAYPGRRWEGRVARVSPIFREGSRQARIEVVADNDDGLLKPGMFVRVEAILGRQEEATIVPVEALAERDGRTVLFLLDPDESVVRMTPVEVGIREGGRVQILTEGISGTVVTLGQQLVSDGSAVTIPERNEPAAADAATPEAGGA